MVDSHKLFNNIIHKLCHEIGGDWLLAGGALVLLEYDGTRATQDMDLAFIDHPSESKESLLNRLYQELIATHGVGPELVNPAMEFFLERLQGWRSHVSLYESGPKGRIFRPDLTLFCALKMMRASELDFSDIEKAIDAEGVDQLEELTLKKWLPPSTYTQWKKFLKN